MSSGRQPASRTMMKEFARDGAVIISGPFAPTEIEMLRRAYDAVQASARGAQVKCGSTSTRFGGLAAQDPFYRIYLHEPLLSLALERIGAAFKLSSFSGRTLHPHTPAPPLHQDVQRGADGDPLVGFIYMVDAFSKENGATRYAPGSQCLSLPPPEGAERRACGPAGAMLIFDGLVWHEHGANKSDGSRRSIQGYFVRRDHTAATDWSKEIGSEQKALLSVAARDLLCI